VVESFWPEKVIFFFFALSSLLPRFVFSFRCTPVLEPRGFFWSFLSFNITWTLSPLLLLFPILSVSLALWSLALFEFVLFWVRLDMDAPFLSLFYCWVRMWMFFFFFFLDQPRCANASSLSWVPSGSQSAARQWCVHFFFSRLPLVFWARYIFLSASFVVQIETSAMQLVFCPSGRHFAFFWTFFFSFASPAFFFFLFV